MRSGIGENDEFLEAGKSEVFFFGRIGKIFRVKLRKQRMFGEKLLRFDNLHLMLAFDNLHLITLVKWIIALVF